mgnify:CR=1 FL=1
MTENKSFKTKLELLKAALAIGKNKVFAVMAITRS